MPATRFVAFYLMLLRVHFADQKQAMITDAIANVSLFLFSRAHLIASHVLRDHELRRTFAPSNFLAPNDTQLTRSFSATSSRIATVPGM